MGAIVEFIPRYILRPVLLRPVLSQFHLCRQLPAILLEPGLNQGSKAAIRVQLPA
jgi:hypothetical protein